MKPRPWMSGVLILAALAIGAVAFRQQRDLARLRGELGSLQAAATQRQAAKTGTPPARPAATGQPLSESEKLELLRLRAQVTRLQERRRELASVRQENEALKQRQRAAGPAGAGSVPLPAGYVRRAQAQFLGAATPEATLQSFFWALEHRDTNVLFQVLTREAAAHLQRELDNRPAEDFWEASRLPGFRVAAVEPRTEDEILLSLEIIPGEPPVPMTLTREAGRWHVSP